MPPPNERSSVSVKSERAVLAAVRLPDSSYDTRDPFGELKALAEQAGGVVVAEMEQRLQRPVAATFMGSGKVDELKLLCDEMDASVVIFDHDLSPSQIGNIEEVVGRKVIDRSELILDIFAARATTHEAKLQVELAQLEYTYPRLRAMWSHLERIAGTGGIGGMGTRGPGEQQLEIDRRIVQRKKVDLERELAVIHGRKRRLVRDRRKDHFTVCLVGYTNAGKSTLFNTLTAGGAYADDRLFATLVTRTREWEVGGQGEGAEGSLRVMLSDTVGFVRDLPHNLVASFRATLEEATSADLLLVVLDASDPAADMQHQTVITTLDELIKEAGERAAKEADASWHAPQRLLLLNKVDRLADNRNLLIWERSSPGCVPISAVDPSHPGHAAVRSIVRAAAQGSVAEYEISVPIQDGKTVLAIEKRGQVLDRHYDEDHAVLRVRMGTRQLDQVRSVAGWGGMEVRTINGAV
ncbi:MAG: GTPase HflX [Phycisphaerales bacterium]|nr:GTPase HflX [Phycisphaerales bacterium]